MDLEYHSYLLRLWVIGIENGQRHWMASLEKVITNQKFVFTTIDALLDYIISITKQSSSDEKDFKKE